MNLTTQDIEGFVTVTLVKGYDTRGHLERLIYAGLGCAEEGGEVAGVVKKMLRGGWKYDENFRLKIAEELGDVLYYVVLTARELNYDLGDIAYLLNQKLQKRRGDPVHSRPV